MIDEKPLFRPRMLDARIRQVTIGDYLHSRPCEPTLLSPPPDGVEPTIDQMVPERRNCRRAHRHGVVGHLQDRPPCCSEFLFSARLWAANFRRQATSRAVFARSAKCLVTCLLPNKMTTTCCVGEFAQLSEARRRGRRERRSSRRPIPKYRRHHRPIDLSCLGGSVHAGLLFWTRIEISRWLRDSVCKWPLEADDSSEKFSRLIVEKIHEGNPVPKDVIWVNQVDTDREDGRWEGGSEHAPK